MRPLLQRSVRPPLLGGWLFQQLLPVAQITAGLPAAPYAPTFAEAARLQLTGTQDYPILVKGEMTTPNLQCPLSFLRCPFHFALPAFQQKSFLNNRSASCKPSLVSTTDFALLMGSEI
jgi:hypothetical protein